MLNIVILVLSAVMTVLQLWVSWLTATPGEFLFPYNFIISQISALIAFAIVYKLAGKAFDKSPERSHKVAAYFRISAGAYAALQGIPMLVYLIYCRVTKKQHFSNTKWISYAIILLTALNAAALFIPGDVTSMLPLASIIIGIFFAIRSENERSHM